MYALDHEETLPSSTIVWDELSIDAGRLHCPQLQKKSGNDYGYNSAVSNVNLQIIEHCEAVIITADCRSIAPNSNILQSTADIDSRHAGKAIASFADGHVDTIDIKRDLLAVKHTPRVK